MVDRADVVHRIECDCGFVVEAPQQGEAIDAARRHADEAHGLTLADGLLEALTHPVQRSRNEERER